MTVVAKFEPWRAELCDAEPGWRGAQRLAELAPPLTPRVVKVDRLLLKMPVRLGPMVNDLPKPQNISRGSRSLLLTRCGQRVPP